MENKVSELQKVKDELDETNKRETYERIIQIKPGQKALLMSGFIETEEVRKTQNLGAGRYIKKPLTLELIGKAVKEVLSKVNS